MYTGMYRVSQGNERKETEQKLFWIKSYLKILLITLIEGNMDK